MTKLPLDQLSRFWSNYSIFPVNYFRHWLRQIRFISISSKFQGRCDSRIKKTKVEQSKIFNPLVLDSNWLILSRDFRLALLEIFQRCASTAAKVHRGFNGSIDTEHYTWCILTSILDPSAMLVKRWNTLLDTTNMVSIFTAFERANGENPSTLKFTIKKFSTITTI